MGRPGKSALKACLGGIALGWLLAAMATPAVACQPGDGGAVTLSNYELVQSTPVIVLARAKALIPVKAGDWPHRVQMELSETLKGNLQSAHFSLAAWDQFQGVGDESDFSLPRPGARAGSCWAFDYRAGGLYLLFLRPQSDGTLAVDGPILSRVNEEVGSQESPWVVAVRHYVRVARLQSDDAESKALRQLLNAPRDGSGALPAALQTDIARHFDTPTDAKPLKRLLAMYRLARELRTRRSDRAGDAHQLDADEVLWVMARRDGAELLPVFHELLKSGAWRHHRPVLHYMAKKHPTLAARLAQLERSQPH